MTVVTGPGFYDVAESVYHADTALVPELGRSLSQSGAKTLLESPAKFAYQREHGTGHKAVFDFGHAAHKYVLGVGERIVRVEADSWRTKAARDARDAAYAAGAVPVLSEDDDRALALAAAVRAHPLAGKLFAEGRPEQSFYWVDPDTGVTCRGRADWIIPGRAVVDLKSCQDASPGAFAKSVANYGYHQQDSWYSDGIEATTGERLPFLFVAVEKEPPHLVGVYQLDTEAVTVGAALNREALALYAECESTGVWPGYSPDIEPLSLPRWATYAHENRNPS